MKNKKVIRFPVTKESPLVRIQARLDEQLRQLLSRDDIGSNKSLWPKLAATMWAHICTKFVEASGRILLPPYPDADWNYRSGSTLTFYEVSFGFDGALHPRLFRYLLKRMPVIARRNHEATRELEQEAQS